MGGSLSGLYGALFSPQGDIIVAHGYQGALHLWKKSSVVFTEGATGQLTQQWQSVAAPGGHFGPVQDVSWEPGEGRYLVSVSSDQTARLLAPWVRKEEEGEQEATKVSLCHHCFLSPVTN